jgi:RNA polymerase sigma-70 factor (ECF subfamily)
MGSSTLSIAFFSRAKRKRLVGASGPVLILGVESRRALAFRMDRDAGGENIPDLEDVRLVRGMIAGKSESLGKFYDKWSGRVYAVAVSIVGEPLDAEEIVEETFFQAWSQAARFDVGRGSAGSWLLNIARSRALDRLKAIRRRREDFTDVAESSLSTEGMDAAQEVILSEQSDAIKIALGRLPAEQRQAIEMSYFGGLSQVEIAESTGQALGTVKTRMRLAMQKLRDQLAPLHEARA